MSKKKKNKKRYNNKQTPIKNIDIYDIIDLIKNNKLIAGGVAAALLIFIVVLASLNNKKDTPAVSENREIIELVGFGEGAGSSGNNITVQYEGEQGDMTNITTDNNTYYDTTNNTAVNQDNGEAVTHASYEGTEPINVTLEENETTIIGNVSGDTSTGSASTTGSTSSGADNNNSSGNSDTGSDDSGSYSFELPFVPADEL